MSAVAHEVSVVGDVADAFAHTVVDAFATRRGARFSLVLSGGPTARLCYERLAEVGAAAVDWNLVDVLIGDERCVAPDDPDANQRLVREALLDQVAPVGSFHPMSCADGPDAYRAVLELWPELDLVHLGLGTDGHTASLFCDSPVLDSPPEQLVAMAVDPHGRNTYERMTLTYSAIGRARMVVFTVSGAAKRQAFADVRAGVDIPASRVRAGRVRWLVDPAAAG
ncbi:MAG: 6-phosphogluconolactonase [Acidimicrobiales bacterium]